MLIKVDMPLELIFPTAKGGLQIPAMHRYMRQTKKNKATNFSTQFPNRKRHVHKYKCLQQSCWKIVIHIYFPHSQSPHNATKQKRSYSDLFPPDCAVKKKYYKEKYLAARQFSPFAMLRMLELG